MFIEIEALTLYAGVYDEVMPYTFPIIQDTASAITGLSSTVENSDKSSFPIDANIAIMIVLVSATGIVLIKRKVWG